MNNVFTILTWYKQIDKYAKYLCANNRKKHNKTEETEIKTKEKQMHMEKRLIILDRATYYIPSKPFWLLKNSFLCHSREAWTKMPTVICLKFSVYFSSLVFSYNSCGFPTGFKIRWGELAAYSMCFSLDFISTLNSVLLILPHHL